MFDVGKITRDLQGQFGLFSRSPESQEENRATPENLQVLVGSLGQLTQRMAERREEMTDWLPDAGIITWDRQFAAWQERLNTYALELAKAAPDDRKAVLWTVTAPLLLGFFGGEDSKLPQQTIDAATPFMLSNQLDVDESWRAQQWDLLIEDVKKNAKDVADAVTGGIEGIVVAGVAIVGGYFFLKWLSNR